MRHAVKKHKASRLPTFRLTPFRTKARLIGAQGADAMFALAFDSVMAETSAQDFILEVLIGGLGAGTVVVGADFQFGKGRAGDTVVLGYMGEMEGLGVTIFPPVEDERHGKISSSRIRKALKEGIFAPEWKQALVPTKDMLRRDRILK